MYSSLVYLLLSRGALAGQTAAVPPSLHSAVTAVASDPDAILTPLGDIESIVKAARPEEIAAELPKLMDLYDSPDPKARRGALSLLYGLASRTGSNERTIDTTTDELLVPYLARIAPHLSDADTPVRSMTFYLIATFRALSPTPPALLHLTLDLLKDPSATVQPPDTSWHAVPSKAPSMGPALLWIILPADATFTRDPSTGITVGRDSAEVQKAIVNFIQRTDQTPESRAETIRALTLSQVQNPAVNAALIPWLTTSDPATQKALLGALTALTLSPEGYTRARVIVGNLIADPQTPAELRSAASALLPCWNMNGNAGLCQPSP